MSFYLPLQRGTFPYLIRAPRYFCNSNASPNRQQILSLASFSFSLYKSAFFFFINKNFLIFSKKTPRFSTRRFRASLIYYLASVCVPFFCDVRRLLAQPFLSRAFSNENFRSPVFFSSSLPDFSRRRRSRPNAQRCDV